MCQRALREAVAALTASLGRWPRWPFTLREPSVGPDIAHRIFGWIGYFCQARGLVLFTYLVPTVWDANVSTTRVAVAPSSYCPRIAVRDSSAVLF